MAKLLNPILFVTAIIFSFCGTTDDSFDAVEDFGGGDFGWDVYTDVYTDENVVDDYGIDNFISGDTVTTANEFPSAELHVKIIGPSGNGRAVVMGAVTSVTGVVFGNYEKLSWASSTGHKGNAYGAPFWQTDAITLNPGDNFITVTAQNALETSTDTIMITYNPGFLFAGSVTLRPSSLFAWENTKVVVTVPFGRYINFDANSIQLLQVDAFGNTIKSLGFMKDDGAVASSGDEIAKDGVFTLHYNFTCNGAPIYLRVAVTAKFATQNYQALSAIEELECVSHLTPTECTNHHKLLISARDKYFEVLKTNGTLAARQAALDLLKADPSVAEAGASTEAGGLWVQFNTGVLGAINLAKPEMRGKGIESGDLEVIESALTPEIPILSRKTLLLSPYNNEFGASNENQFIYNIMKKNQCPVFKTKGAFLLSSALLERFRSMNQHGIVSIVSHGDTYFKELSQEKKLAYGWKHSGSQEVIWTGEAVNCGIMMQQPMTCSSDSQCPQGTKCLITSASGIKLSGLCVDYTQIDLKRGRVVIGDKFYGILPSFVQHYAKEPYPNSIVYLGTCRSLYNGSLAASFFASGAKAVAGYSGYVSTKFAYQKGSEFFAKMIEEKQLAGDAYGIGGQDPDHPGSYFRFFGARNLTINHSSILNPSFETGELTGWTKEGDGRVIGKLGVAKPVVGKFMGVISTGLGYTVDTGEISQSFCLDKDVSKMTFYWKYYSEEFHEWCGSEYQDTFTATLTVDASGQQKTAVNVAVDHLCLPSACFGCGSKYVGLTPSDVQFDQGDTHKTEWQKSVTDVKNMALLGPVTLSFFCTDKGDSIYDTVVLIDGIKFE